MAYVVPFQATRITTVVYLCIAGSAAASSFATASPVCTEWSLVVCMQEDVLLLERQDSSELSTSTDSSSGSGKEDGTSSSSSEDSRYRARGSRRAKPRPPPTANVCG